MERLDESFLHRSSCRIKLSSLVFVCLCLNYDN